MEVLLPSHLLWQELPGVGKRQWAGRDTIGKSVPAQLCGDNRSGVAHGPYREEYLQE